ncbi:stage II sporulation protein E, partial [Streptomyces pharetrae]
TLRRLIRAVLDHHDGDLQDDATILLCEWLGPGRDTAAAAPRAGVELPPGHPGG